MSEKFLYSVMHKLLKRKTSITYKLCRSTAICQSYTEVNKQYALQNSTTQHQHVCQVSKKEWVSAGCSKNPVIENQFLTVDI